MVKRFGLNQHSLVSPWNHTTLLRKFDRKWKPLEDKQELTEKTKKKKKFKTIMLQIRENI